LAATTGGEIAKYPQSHETRVAWVAVEP